MSNVTEFTYSKRKQACPCGQSKSYIPLTSHTSGGKCHSSKCGQKFFPPEPPPKIASNHDEQVYPYRDLKGKIVFETVRYYKNGEKLFYQRRPTANGSYEKGLGQGANRVPLVLYNLPEITRAIAEKQEIFIVEGEKDVETLKRNGLVATCNPMGAGKWRSEFNSSLRDANVIVLPDNDEAGKVHGDKVARELSDVAASVRIVDLPNLPDKGDVSDWLVRGNSVQELRKIASETPFFEPNLHSPIQDSTLPLKTPTNDSSPISEKVFTFSWKNKPPKTDAVISLNKNRIGSRGNVSLLVAPPGTGKSAVCEVLIGSVLNPNCDTFGLQTFLDEGKSLLYADTERSREDFWNSCARALRRAGTTTTEPPKNIHLQLWSLLESVEERVTMLFHFLQNEPIGILILDGIGDFVRSVNDEIECNAFLSRLLAIAKQYEITVFATIHDNPQVGNEKARGHLGSEAMRRAESVLKLQRDKDNRTRTLTSDFLYGKVRNSGDSLSTHFAWDESVSMFLSCNKPNSVAESNLRNLAKDLFASTYSFSYSELIKRMVDTGLNENNAKKRFKQLNNDNLILKEEVSGVWILNQNEFI